MDLFKEHIMRANAAYEKGDMTMALIEVKAAAKVLQQMIKVKEENSQKT